MPLPPTRYEFGDDDSIEESSITQMQSAVFPLVVVTPVEVQCIGTAFCVAGAGVLATARHVVDAADRLIAKAKAEHDGRAGLAAVWYGDPPAGEDGILALRVPITDACRHPDERFDFALLTAAVPEVNDERIHFPSLRLDFAMPEVGDQVIMLGYTRFEFAATEDSALMEQTLRASRGVVKDRYFPIRDSINAPFPCFGTDARCDPGMSGGPALRVGPNGEVSAVGLNISDYDETDAAQHASFVTALRTLLPMEVAMVGPGGSGMSRTLLDLGRDDYLVSDTDFNGWDLTMTEHDVAAAIHPDDASLVNDG